MGDFLTALASPPAKTSVHLTQTYLLPPPAKLAKTSMLTRVCDTHLYRKPTQRASQAAWECVFEVLNGLKGLKGFWACRMRGGASQEQGFVASFNFPKRHSSWAAVGLESACTARGRHACG